MDTIAKARASTNERVARFLRTNPGMSYERVAKKLGVSRWRVMTVAAGMGITRKSGPKKKGTSNSG